MNPVTPFIAIIMMILSLRIILYSPEHEHPNDNISPPHNEQNKKNQPLSNRRHFPLRRLSCCEMLIMIIRDVMYITLVIRKLALLKHKVAAAMQKK